MSKQTPLETAEKILRHVWTRGDGTFQDRHIEAAIDAVRAACDYSEFADWLHAQGIVCAKKNRMGQLVAVDASVDELRGEYELTGRCDTESTPEDN